MHTSITELNDFEQWRQMDVRKAMNETAQWLLAATVSPVGSTDASREKAIVMLGRSAANSLLIVFTSVPLCTLSSHFAVLYRFNPPPARSLPVFITSAFLRFFTVVIRFQLYLIHTPALPWPFMLRLSLELLQSCPPPLHIITNVRHRFKKN